MKKIGFFTLVLALLCFSSPSVAQSFVTVRDGLLERDGKPYYFVGTNFWYGAILGSEGRGGDRQRLCRELDTMKKLGIDNLRILVGADGFEDKASKVRPTLQVSPGEYNDTILAGLDYLLMEMGKRRMVAVLYLNNSWEWSGGYSFYLEHAGFGPQGFPEEIGYTAYTRNMSQFATSTRAHELFHDHVKFIMSRKNRYTGVDYKDDPAIMSWQICNEPRAFSRDMLPAFEAWLAKTSSLMRSLDAHHLISIGSEGACGCEMSYEAYERICADPNIDYCNIHVWPYNWGWAKADSLAQHLDRSIENTGEYIERHLDICARLGKPLVMEEFGFPRDGFLFGKDVKTTLRDKYYDFVAGKIGAQFSGCNFWGWGGLALPKHEKWQPGDDYTGDPAQEAQGLNSVFLSDRSTVKVITRAIKRLKKLCK